MKFKETLKNVNKVLHRNKNYVLPKEIKDKLLKLDELYNNYIDTKDESYIKNILIF